MEISPEEARESLHEIEQVIANTRRSIGRGQSSGILILWGVIWSIGYSASQFFPARSGLVWLPLVAVGVIFSFWHHPRKRQQIKRGPNDSRFGLFWLVLYLYIGIWTFLLYPFNFAHMPAFIATVPMFAYVIGGMWLDRFFVWLGLGVTALAVAGVFLAPGWLNLWMAVTGGGSLIWAGLHVRRHWR